MRRFLIALAVVLTFATPAAAKDFSAYDRAKLDAAIKSGAPVVVHVHAEWCTVCRKQITVLDELFKDPALAKIASIRVNYDVDRDFVAAFKVKRQANIIVFKGGKEVARLDYNPDPDRIRATVRQAL
jgi:thioredoxin 1